MMWNFARSAEEKFSRWAVKRVFKFFLKKKLGQFILGDIDLDQLDVQLGDGTIHLSDLALNVDFINQMLGMAAVVTVAEGSIGSLSINMPWVGKGCEIEINELEIVLTPRVANHSPAGAEKVSGQDGTRWTSNDLGKLEHGKEDHAAAPVSVDVHQGVKTIANMVKRLLTSFRVKVKGLILAFDSCFENEKKTRSEMALVLRIMEIECGTCVSENVDFSGLGKVESFLGIDRLTNFAKFQGAVMELLQMEEVHKKMLLPGSVFGERFLVSRATATIPILTGNHAGFSGTLKLSIPLKSGSLDTCKVDSEVCIDPVELRLQPRVIEWLLLMCKSLQNLGSDSMCEPDQKPEDSIYYNSTSHFHCSALGSSAIATDKASLNNESPCANHRAPKLLGTIAGTLFPSSNLILDWVPSSVEKTQDKAGEADFGASLDQFFECFDELRSSQSALGGSGIWNWTSSVFSAITAASNLTSGSVHIPYEQQHAQTNLKVTVTRFSVLLSFDDECMKQISFRKGGQRNFSPNAHYLGVECEDVHLVLQVSPGEMKVEATVRHVEVSDFFNDGVDIIDFGSDSCENGVNSKTLLVQHLQAKVQDALPPLALSTEDSVKSYGSVAKDFPFGPSSMDDSGGKSIYMDDLVKVNVLKSSDAFCFQYTVNSKFSNDSTTHSTSFSLELPPFVLWVNFNLLKIVLDLWKEIGSYFETRDLRDVIVSEDNNSKHVSSCQENMKGISYPFVATSSPNGSLQGNVTFANARAILCFPFENKRDAKCYPAWDQFIVLNLSSSLPLGKKMKQGQDANTISDVPKRFPLTVSDSLHLNIGNLELYLVTSCQKNGVRNNVWQGKFSAQNVMCIVNGTHSPSHVSLIWQKGPVTGPSLVERAKELAASGFSRNENKAVGKGYEFAAVTTVTDMEESKMHLQQEIIAGSAFLLHACLPPVTVNLDNSWYLCLYSLLNQAIEGLSCLSCGPPSISKSPIASQTSLLVECDYLEISIYPDVARVLEGSMQDQLPGPWHRLRLKVQKFELLSVSNIGGIMSANFNWIGHGQGNLWGLPAGSADKEFVLISCDNSTMRRGDGGGLNALSYGLAGSDIINLSDPKSFNNSTFITVRCGTIVALGGQLDWLGIIFSFFSLASSELDGSDDKQLQKKDSKESDTFGTSFVLDLVDIGLSYEPYVRNMSMDGEVSKFDSSSEGNEGEKHVACILAAASLSLSLVTIADSNDSDYRIKVHDLGLLLSVVSRPENIVGLYSTKHLQEIGYVKVAEEAFVEAILRTNCKNGLLWELECSESHSHIIFDTCHDTAAGLLCLVAQLQQLFSPDVEESMVHLQTRWNNVQKVHEMNGPIHGTKFVKVDSPSSASYVPTINTDTESKPGAFGLMDEISEGAFQLDECLHNASDSFQRQLCISLDGTGEEYNGRARALKNFSHNGQSSFLEKGCIPEVIEGYCGPGLLSPITNQSMYETSTSNSSVMDKGGTQIENSGWYRDTSLNIVENYMSEVKEEDLKQFIEGQLAFNSCTKGGELQGARGRILLKNINVKWRMHSGSDWFDWRQTRSSSFHGRDKTACLELAFYGIDFQCNIFPEGEICTSKVSFSIQNFYLHDKSKDAPWELVLDNYDSKEHPRESSSKAFKLDLEAVRPDPLTPLDEYRLNVAFLPMRLHLHQTQLDFLINFFEGKTFLVEQSSSLPPDFDESPSKYNTNQHTVGDEAPLPYFQKVDVWPFLIRVDYTPSHVDLAALRDGKYVELVNLVPWKGVELRLKHVHAVGVYGWGTVCENVMGDWLEDISQNQIHKLLRGLPPIRSLVTVGSAAAKLVSLPVKSYKKDHRLLKGMQRGTIAFLKSISIEAIGLGLHLTAGVHDILLETEYILTSVPASVSLPAATRTKKKVRSNQPKDAHQGFQQAYENLSDGLGRSASALVQAPLKSYQRGAGAGSALATAICAAPAAAIAPASAAAGAIRFALLGVRNSLDPEHMRESMKKYLGPTQPHEPS